MLCWEKSSTFCVQGIDIAPRAGFGDAEPREGCRFSKAMENPGFIGIEDIRNTYMKRL